MQLLNDPHFTVTAYEPTPTGFMALYTSYDRELSVEYDHYPQVIMKGKLSFDEILANLLVMYKAGLLV